MTSVVPDLLLSSQNFFPWKKIKIKNGRLLYAQFSVIGIRCKFLPLNPSTYWMSGGMLIGLNYDSEFESGGPKSRTQQKDRDTTCRVFDRRFSLATLRSSNFLPWSTLSTLSVPLRRNSVPILEALTVSGGGLQDGPCIVPLPRSEVTTSIT